MAQWIQWLPWLNLSVDLGGRGCYGWSLVQTESATCVYSKHGNSNTHRPGICCGITIWGTSSTVNLVLRNTIQGTISCCSFSIRLWAITVTIGVYHLIMSLGENMNLIDRSTIKESYSCLHALWESARGARFPRSARGMVQYFRMVLNFTQHIAYSFTSFSLPCSSAWQQNVCHVCPWIKTFINLNVKRCP